MGMRRTQNQSLEIYVRSAADLTALFRSLQLPTPQSALKGINPMNLRKILGCYVAYVP